MKQLCKRVFASISAMILLLTSGAQLPAQQQSTTAHAASQTIINDTFWKDTSGNYIYSQGGGVFQFGDTYYCVNCTFRK